MNQLITDPNSFSQSLRAFKSTMTILMSDSIRALAASKQRSLCLHRCYLDVDVDDADFDEAEDSFFLISHQSITRFCFSPITKERMILSSSELSVYSEEFRYMQEF